MKALILVDIQNDFCPGGALAVAAGDEVVPVANRLMPLFPLVVATQDWHPPSHGSFAINHPGRKPYELGDLGGLPQVFWPAHCVQNTTGANFHPHLAVDRIKHVVHKGTDPSIDSYSGFFDNGKRKATKLADCLKQEGAQQLYVVGLATDYCVRATVLDALALGFQVTLVVDGCRGVNLSPGDSDRAVEDMRAAGAIVCASQEVAQNGAGVT